MLENLIFDDRNYEIRTLELEGRSITYREFKNIVYVENPIVPEYQKLNLFVPEAYYHGECVNGFSRDTAPIFLPNTVGAYMSGRADEPGYNFRSYGRGKLNNSFVALEKGLVVAAVAARGSDLTDEAGHYVGVAPAVITDLKAAVRYLRHNRNRIPGDVERIISDGTSAGGAMSALLGASGNAEEFEPYLKSAGAAQERDDIYAAVCYCPIMNLEHADMAYEWLLDGLYEYDSLRFYRVGDHVEAEPYSGTLTEEEIAFSQELKEKFVRYLNSLNLETKAGIPLRLNEDGRGSFRDYLSGFMRKSAQKALDQGVSFSQAPYLKTDGEIVTEFDLDAYVQACGRMKKVPSFDQWDGANAENRFFGTAKIREMHFTKEGLAHDTFGCGMADEKMIRMMNPMTYCDGAASDVAPHWWVRHGAADCHTSWAISLIFAESLSTENMNFAYAWGQSHAGDYDMDELMDWVEEICRAKES